MVSSRTKGIRVFGSPMSRPTSPATILQLRGGAISVDEEDIHMPPRISAQDMAMALRWTGEVNRRLQEGTRSGNAEVSTRLVPPTTDDMRGGESTLEPSLLTLFHAASPRSSGNGASRWGPDLEAYLSHICQQLNLPPDASAELSLHSCTWIAHRPPKHREAMECHQSHIYNLEQFTEWF